MRVAALATVLFAAFGAWGAAHAADRVKVGFLSTLSGPSGYFGNEARDGFNLLVKSKGGQLGGLPAEVVVADDQVNPEQAKQTVERLVKKDRVDFVAGTIYGNVMMATVPVVAEA